MFKSIEYKLILYLILLLAVTIIAVYSFMDGDPIYGILALFAGTFFIGKLRKHYKKFDQNVIFLLNSLENGDYSFNFTERKKSGREKELNMILNHMKQILVSAREEVIQNERFLSLIIESVSTGIIIMDDMGRIQTVNESASKLLGQPVLTHINQLKSIDKALPAIFKALLPGEPVQVKIANEREEMQMSLNVSSITLNGKNMRVVTFSNIGNELEAKEMESWIKLIRVMTHEIMNSIAPITSLSDTMIATYRSKERADSAELARNTIEAFDTINSTAKGLLNFVDSYRKFTGVPTPERKDFDLLPLLDKVVTLGAASYNGTVKVEAVFGSDTFIVNADEQQMTQVLVNLLKNATEAIGDTEGGEIKVTVGGTGSHPRIEVSNNGGAIPSDVLPHIFVPFFTTKEDGTGIGLSVSRYIMRLHGGNLRYRSEGDTSVFIMEF